MLNKIFLLFLILVSCLLHSQKVEVKYKSYSVKNFTTEELKSMPPMQRQMLQSMKDGINDMEYILKIDSLTSEFTTVFKLPTPGKRNLTAQVENDQIYYSTPEKFIHKKKSLGTEVLIEGFPYEYKWDITSETKTILGYECYFAKTTILESGGNTLEIEAWFAPSLPYSFGPKIYQGLPGLILETVQNKGILLRASQITIDANIFITEPSGGRKVTRKEHEKKLQEQHEMMMSRMKN